MPFLPTDYWIILVNPWTYLHFYIHLFLHRLAILLFFFYFRFGFSATHVRQSLLGAQLSNRGWGGHSVIYTRCCLGQLQREVEETFWSQYWWLQSIKSNWLVRTYTIGCQGSSSEVWRYLFKGVLFRVLSVVVYNHISHKNKHSWLLIHICRSSNTNVFGWWGTNSKVSVFDGQGMRLNN